MKHFFDKRILDESKTRQNDNQFLLPDEKKKKGFFERRTSDPEKNEKKSRQNDRSVSPEKSKKNISGETAKENEKQRKKNEKNVSPEKKKLHLFERKTSVNEKLLENKSDKSNNESNASGEKKKRNPLETKTGESSNPENKPDKNNHQDRSTSGEKKKRFFFERRMTVSKIDEVDLENNRGDKSEVTNMKETKSDSLLTGQSSAAVKQKKKAGKVQDKEDEKTKEESSLPPLSMKDVKSKGSSALDILKSLQRNHSASFYLAATKDSDSKETKTESSFKQNESLLKKIKERIKKDKTGSQIILVNEDDYWTETVSTNTDIHKSNLLFLCSLLNIDQSAKVYGKDFAMNEHHNYAIEDIYGQKMILSVMLDPSESNSVYRTIIRTSDKTLPSKIETWQADQPMSLEQIAKHTFPGTRIAHYSEITADDAVDALKTFDEQTISNTFKFGMFYQKSGQITEEEMFNNRKHSTFMQDFLDFIAIRVKLADFKGFSGGLDTQHDLTGTDSYYQVFEGNEIMFHVSTLLPFNENDPQQIERKRHIGNDIVAVVFQDPGAKFCPEVISSQFLQVFLCVQPSLTEKKEITYKMAVVAKAEVSHFGPFLDGLGVYSKNDVLKKCFYSKLINAQISACTSAGKIGSMLERRRQMLFQELYTKLTATEKHEEPPKVTNQNPNVPNGEMIVRFIKNRSDSTDSDSEIVFERPPNAVHKQDKQKNS